MKTNPMFKRLAALILSAMMLACAAVPAFAEDVVVADCCEGLTPGDANEDGEADFKDVTVMIRYSAGYDLAINQDNADVQNNGEVDMKDIALLVRVLAGWTDVRLGHLDEYQICTLCGSKSENFDAKAALFEWTKDNDDLEGAGAPNSYEVLLGDTFDVETGFGESTYLTYYYDDLYGTVYEIFTLENMNFLDENTSVYCIIDLLTDDLNYGDMGFPEDILYAVSWAMDHEVYDEEGNTVEGYMLGINGAICEDGRFEVVDGYKLDFADLANEDTSLTAEELAAWGEEAKAGIAGLVEVADSVFAERAPFTAEDLGLRFE